MARDTKLAFDILTKYSDKGVDQAEKGLKGLTKTADKQGKEGGKSYAVGFSKNIEPLGGRVSGFMKSSLGKVAGIAGGLVAGGAFASAFGDALEQGDATAKLRGQLNLTEKQAAKAAKIAGTLYKNNFGESVGAVNDTIRKVIQDTNLTMRSLNLKPVTAKVLTITETFEQETGQVTRAAGQLIRTGLSKNMGDALDVITAGFDKGADKSEDFLDTLNEYSTLFRNLGLNGAKSIGLLTQGLEAGARDSDKVADALKEFSIRAVNDTAKLAPAFKAIGLEGGKMASAIAKGGKPAAKALDLTLDRLRQMEPGAKRTRIAVELFGTQAEDLGDALFKLDPSEATKKLGKLEGRARGLVDVIGGTANAKIQGFIRTMKQGFVEALGAAIKGFVNAEGKGKGFIGFMSKAGATVRKVTDAIGKGVDWAKRHSDALTILGATVAGALVPFGIYKTVILGVAKAKRIWAAAQAALNLVMRANPIGLVITAIAGITAGLIMAYKKSETFRKIVDGAFSAVAKAGSFMWNKVLKPVFSTLVNAFLWVAEKIVSGAAKAFGWVPGIGDKLKSAAEKFKQFKENVNNALGGIKDKDVNVTGKLRFGGAGTGATAVNRLLSSVPARARGGLMPGPPSSKDNMLALVASGEFWVNAQSTKKHRALLEAINADRVPGFANGGLVPRANVPGPGQVGNFAGSFDKAMNHAAERFRQVLGKAAAQMVPAVSGVPSSVGGNAAIVKSIFSSMFGWARYWPQTYSLLMKESGFRNTAQNPTSTAYGMFQFLDSTWGGYGIPKTSDPRLQTIAGGRYIAGRYGNPANALAFHLRNNWYDRGGMLQSGRTAVNKSGKPERVLSPRQTSSFERLVDALTGGIKQSDAPVARQLKQLNRALFRLSRLLRKADKDWFAGRALQVRERLAGLLKRRERLDDRLERAISLRDKRIGQRREVAGGLRSGIFEQRNLVGGFGIDHDGSFSAGDIAGQLEKNLAKTRRFQRLLRKMRRQGFRANVIGQVAQAGPEEGFDTAKALANARGSEVRRINQSFVGIHKAATNFSKEMGRKLYGAGIQAARGLVQGLRDRRRQIQRTMRDIARSLIKAMKDALEMRSPSKVMRKLGFTTIASAGEGMAEAAPGALRVVDRFARDIPRRARDPRPVRIPRCGDGGGNGGVNLTVNVYAPSGNAKDIVHTIRQEIRNNVTFRRELGAA